MIYKHRVIAASTWVNYRTLGWQFYEVFGILVEEIQCFVHYHTILRRDPVPRMLDDLFSGYDVVHDVQPFVDDTTVHGSVWKIVMHGIVLCEIVGV